MQLVTSVLSNIFEKKQGQKLIDKDINENHWIKK